MRTINELCQEAKDRVDLMLTSTDYETGGANALLPYLPANVNRESLDAYIEQVVDSAIRGKRGPIECCGKSIGQLLAKIDPEAPKRSFHLKPEAKESLEEKMEGFKVVDIPKKKRGRPPKTKLAAKPKKKDPAKVELPPIINADPTPPPKNQKDPRSCIPAGIPVVEIEKDRYIAIQLTVQDGKIVGVDEFNKHSINPPYYEQVFRNLLEQLSHDKIIAEYLAVDEEAGIMQFRFKRTT